ncbi:MAG TPA: methyltransferase domain-containing protein [Candidatus Nitrosotenuis sp.]|nr:methyltransferase domain-containing protein [Candidatus Nitrosotenuis sp.]
MIETPKNLVPKFFGKTAETYEQVALWTTFGKDRFWKNEIIKQIAVGDSILDLGCGTGILTRMIADKFPHSRIIGVDVSASYLEVAKRNSSQYKNIEYVHQDAEQLSLGEKFDCIVSSYIPKYCDAKRLVNVCVNHLNRHGMVILHDFTFPKNKAVSSLWQSYFMLLRSAGVFIPSWHDAFVGLPKLIISSTWLSDYGKELKENGFDVTERSFTWNTAAMLVGSTN